MPPMTLQDFAEALGARCVGDGALPVKRAVEPGSTAREGDVAIALGKRFVARLSGSGVAAAVLSAEADLAALGLRGAVILDSPLGGLSRVTNALAPEPNVAIGRDDSAVIDGTATLGPDFACGPFVHIAPQARVGARARILSHVSIGAGAVIGDDALIHSGVRIGAGVVIGDRAILHPNCVIGADGFSFEGPPPGMAFEGGTGFRMARNASLGGVVLGDDVEIGAGTTIDRGTLRDTILGDGVKTDNLVQIAHNVEIGAHTRICAQVGIAGSARIGARCILGGQSGIADQVRISDDCAVAAASAVASNIPKPGTIVMGTPAIRQKERVAQALAERRLPKLLARIEALEKHLAAMDSGG